jgi:biotin/methionine sulfoxide reductase
MLTRDHGTSKLGQGPSSATVLVDIEPWRAPLPPVRAFTPPAIAQENA